MKIIEEALTFDIVTTLALYPEWEDRHVYASFLRKINLNREADELENKFSYEDFYYYLYIYEEERIPRPQ